MILADSSVWIEFLRGTSSPVVEELDERLKSHDVLMCGPVATELLVGTGTTERRRLWEALTALAWIDLGRMDWFVAATVRADLRERGMQVSFPDALIAAAAATRATLWTYDRDFERIAEVLDALDLRLLVA